MKAPLSVKKIFCTTYAPSTPEKVAAAIVAVSISSSINVPRFAGRIPFSATEAA